jgi:hypothetical protein
MVWTLQENLATWKLLQKSDTLVRQIVGT